LFKLQNYKISNVKNDVLSGSVVAMALVPEAIAFSLIAGVNPQVGLYTAFILGLIAALIGGKPGMISGATGAVAIVMVSLVAEHGLQYLLWATILAGLIQISIGLLKLGKFIRLVPQPAMFGFVNGLAIVIATAQFPYFQGEGAIMITLVIATMAIMHFLPRYTSAIPASLAAIILISFVVIFFDLDTKRVGDLADISGAFPSFALPDAPLNFETLQIILPYAVIMALVGLIESLLTISVLDEMSGTRGDGNKECIAQGVGNTTCGFFGGMAGCVMIGQSIINYTSGGLGRLSGIFAAILLILFVVSLSSYISLVPVAVLVGIMFMVSIATFEWSSFHRLKYMHKEDIAVMLIVTVVTVVEDLATAVIIGIILSALSFAWKHARIFAKTKIDENGSKVYELDGPLFFGSATTFSDVFDFENDPQKVIIDFKDARIMDGSGVEAIDKITKKYQELGKTLVIRHLSEDCKVRLQHAGPYCTHEEDDPTYKVAVNLS
jgi:SulP family sulfate permease